MKLKQLEALVAVVDSESISAAAETLGISQSALTKIIAQLEADLGVTLLERGGGRRAQPTQLGQIVYDRGSSILTSAEGLERHLGQVQKGFSQVIRIGFGVSVPTKRITQIAAHLRERMPNCALRLRTGLRRHLIPRLRKQEFDFLISMESKGDEADDLLLDRLWEDRFCVFMSPSSKILAEKSGHGTGLKWVASDRLAELNTGASKFFSDFLPAATFAQVDAYESNMIKAMLNSGPFISAWPFETFADDVAQGDLASIEIPSKEERSWRCRINMVSLKGARRSRTATSARQLIKRMMFG